jgi:predicted transcriptional regulator
MTPREMRAIRAKLNITQGDLAERLGYGVRIVQYWEAGHTPIPRLVDREVRRMLNFSLDNQQTL